MSVLRHKLFALDAPLGHGAMSRLFSGHRRTDDAPIVLKTVLEVGGATPEFLKREIRVLKRLDHPNIVRLYDSFISDGKLWVALEWFDGVSLFRAIPPAVAPSLTEVSAKIFGQLHDALDYLHSCQIVHADLKPPHILVDAQGTIRLVDFELSRSLVADDFWDARPVVFTPRYASPEHMQGEPIPESDYFVVGLLLLEFLTASNPLNGLSIPDVLRKLVTGNANELLHGAVHVDRDIYNTLRSLLDSRPSARREGWDRLALHTRRTFPGVGSATANVMPLHGGPHVFISYSRTDYSFARRVADTLEKRGIRVWIDSRAISSGESISRRIEQALERCTHVVVLLSPSAVVSRWVDAEWRAAFSRELETGTPTIIPAILSPCTIPTLLRDRNCVNLLESYKPGIESLMRRLAKG